MAAFQSDGGERQRMADRKQIALNKAATRSKTSGGTVLTNPHGQAIQQCDAKIVNFERFTCIFRKKSLILPQNLTFL